MTDVAVDAWARIRAALATDARVGPQLHGFISLVEPKGVMAGVLYLEVPNDFTRSMLEQRGRIPLAEAIGGLEDEFEIHTFAVTVNPDIARTTSRRPRRPGAGSRPAPSASARACRGAAASPRPRRR